MGAVTSAPPVPARRRPSPGAVLIGVVVLVAVLLAGARSLDAARTDILDPENARPNGARAAAQVLADLGVDVRVARGRAELDAAGPPGSSTLVVTSTDELGDSTLHHLDEVAARAGARVVYVDPTPEVAAHVGGDRLRPVEVTTSLVAECPGRYDGLTLAVTRAQASASDGCFDTDAGALLTEPAPGVTFFGAGQALHNGRITDGDNAAVALRLLGQADHLVWYVPTSTDLLPDETGAAAVLPDWIGPALWLLLLAGLTLALWRGRRLGPLASEPVPVVVHAIETTAGSGRLLRRGGDRTHAATVLRASARRRLATHLQLDGADLHTLVGATAQRVGATPAEVAELVAPDAPVPPTDATLVRLGQQLAALTEEVTRR